MAKYVKAANVGDIPDGEGIVVEIEGRPIAVFNKDGEYFATDDTCPHQGGSLGQGEIDGDEIVCPWHEWRFNIKNGDSLEIPGFQIDTFETKIEGSDILVEVTWT